MIVMVKLYSINGNPIENRNKMRSLRRTNAVDFTEISDDDSYYSAGETSDDLTNDNQQLKLSKDKNNENDPLSSFISIQQHLSSIDAKVSDRSQISQIFPFNDEDFFLERLSKPFNPINNSTIRPNQETIGCAIINIAHATQYKNVVSEYFNTNKQFVAWNAIPYTPKSLSQFISNNDNKDSSSLASSSIESTTSVSDFPLQVHSFYKEAYNSYRTQIRFVHFASPSADKLDTIRNARKEIPNSRILFHYVGYGYPDPEDGCIYTCEGKKSNMTKYKVEKLVDYIKPPSIFIFDCNKAGTLFNSLIECSRQHINNENNSENRSDYLKSQYSWKNVYCLCATRNESLPRNSKLPRDFLTSCLLSPIQTSILCHIVQYFNTTSKFGKDPFEYVKKNFNKFNNGKINELVEILHSITDSIASEILDPSLFTQIFRGDHIISSFFYHFMLAQYLLQPYGVHPISYPVIPYSSALHPLWMEWSSTLDTLITSALTPLPSFSSNLFWRASTIFRTGKPSAITRAILTLMCHAMFLNYGSNTSKNKNIENLSLQHSSSSSSNYYYSLDASTSNLISPSKLKLKTRNFQLAEESTNSSNSAEFNQSEQISFNAIRQLAEFASKSEKNRENLSQTVTFGLLFKKFLKYFNENTGSSMNLMMSRSINFNNCPKIVKRDEFHSLCFLLISLLQTNLNLFYEIKSDSDFSKLPLVLFDKSFNQTTLSFVAAILASTVSFVNSAKITCSSHEFLLKLKESIPTFSPQLLLWCLILLKKTFDNSSIEEDLFVKDSIHMQVAAVVFHNDFECRASTISSLTCFMQKKGYNNSNSNYNGLLKNTGSPNSPNFNHNFDNSFNYRFNSNVSISNNIPSSSSSNEIEDDNQNNKTLFFIPFPSFCDVSYLVRFQYLLFVIKFLTASRSLYEKMLGNSSSSPSSYPTNFSSTSDNNSLPQHSSSQTSQNSKPVSEAMLNVSITDLHSKICDMMNIDTITFKNIVAEWMCLIKPVINTQTIETSSRSASVSSSASSVPNHSLNSTSSNQLFNNSFNSSNESLFYENGSMSFEFGTTNFESFAKIVDSVCKRDDVKIRMYAMSLFLLDYFSHDPHPSIRSTAIKAKRFFSLDGNKGSAPNPQVNDTDAKIPTPPLVPTFVTRSSSSTAMNKKVQNDPPSPKRNASLKHISSSTVDQSGKTKGNFFSHFNKKQQQQQQQQHEVPVVQNPPLNASPTESQTISSLSGSASPTFSSVSGHSADYALSSNIQHAGNDSTNSSSPNASSKYSSPNIFPSAAFYDKAGQNQSYSGQREEEISESSCDSSQSSTFFESDSQALFNVAFKNLVRGGQWCINNKEEGKEKARPLIKPRKKSPKSSNLGLVDVPAISIQIRAHSKSLTMNASSATSLVYDKEMMRLAVSTKDRQLYLFNDSLNIIKKIKAGDSDISDVKFVNNIFCDTECSVANDQIAQIEINDFYPLKNSTSNPELSSISSSSSVSNISPNVSKQNMQPKSLCAFATCDGCVKLWDSRNNEPCMLWRASSTFNDDKTPLYFTSAEIEQTGQNPMNYSSHIITGRGSDEICVWDLMTQKLVIEYISNSLVKEYNKQVSAMTVHPSDPNVIVIGYTNGLITSIDTRAPSNFNSSINSYSSSVSNISLNFSLPGEKIVSFCKNTNGGDSLYAATSKGNVVVWNTTTSMISTSYLSRKFGISSFSAHQMLPMIAYSNKMQSPIIASTQNKVLLETNQSTIPANSIVAFHPVFPVVTFASPNGDISTYNILIAH